MGYFWLFRFIPVFEQEALFNDEIDSQINYLISKKRRTALIYEKNKIQECIDAKEIKIIEIGKSNLSISENIDQLNKRIEFLEKE